MMRRERIEIGGNIYFGQLDAKYSLLLESIGINAFYQPLQFRLGSDLVRASFVLSEMKESNFPCLRILPSIPTLRELDDARSFMVQLKRLFPSITPLYSFWYGSFRRRDLITDTIFQDKPEEVSIIRRPLIETLNTWYPENNITEDSFRSAIDGVMNKYDEHRQVLR